VTKISDGSVRLVIDNTNCVHDWGEEYYGYRCKKCPAFIPYGCEPWVDYSDDDNSAMAADYDYARSRI